MRYITISVLLLWSCVQLLAGNITYLTSETKSNFVANSTNLRLVTPQFQSVSDSNTVFLRHGIVRLVYGRELNTDVAGQQWQFRIIVQTTYNSSASTIEQKVDTLLVEHQDETGVFEAIGQYPNLYWGDIRTEILKVEANVGSGWTTSGTTISQIPNDIRLELQLVETRFNYLNPSAQLSIQGNYQYTANSNSYLDVQWQYLSGMESVEIEYVYWDAQDTDNPGTGNAKKLFAHATRVETNQSSYRIELTYPEGTLYYRVRPVGRFIRNVNGDYSHLQFGEWSTIGTQTIQTGFESTMNWQYTSTFAEEGKQKKVITYFDESPRARQVVTYLNDVQRTLVGETDYSIEGQQVVSILPVPANPQDNNLFFKPNFNKNGNNQAYSYRDFDKIGGADPVANTSGAGQYYSANNPNNTDLYRDYIPDAQGFPLSQMRYTRDNTGRVAAQGGVGAFYQLGQGRETRYYYGSATNTELRRLFGSNVGIHRHYDKNLVVDPNGQVSITYVDQTGKTIATALAGANPNNVLPLDSKNTFNAPVQLIDGPSVSNNVSSHETVITNTIINNTANFTYDLVGTYNALSLKDINLCLPCTYNLEILVLNEETGLTLPFVSYNNANLITSTSPSIGGGGMNTNYTLQQTFTGAQLQSCITGTAYSTTAVTFQTLFQEIGSYRVRKTLSLSTTDAQAALAELTILGAIPSPTAWINAAIAAIDTTSCDIFGTADSSQFAQFATQAQQSQCQSLLTQMRQQVLPGGPFDSTVIANTACWANKSFEIEDINGNSYIINNNGSTFNILDENGDTTGLTSITIEGVSGNLLISDWLSFQLALVWGSAIFQNAWADALVQCHREYCHYELCQNTVASSVFDARLTQYNTWSDVVNAGIVTTTNDYTGLSQNDPFYTLASNPSIGATCNPHSLMLAEMDSFSGGNLNIVAYITDAVNQINAARNSIMTTSEMDTMKWSMFRGSYSELKFRFRNQCSGCTFYSDTNAVVQDNPLASIDTPEEIQQWSNNQQTDHCDMTCEANVNYWMQRFQYSLDSCNATYTQANLDSIRLQLELYCADICGPENPNAVMLEEDLQNNVHLYNAFSIVLNLYSDPSCGSSIGNLLTPFDSVYSWATDSNNVVVNVPNGVPFALTTCIQSYLNIFSNVDFPSFTGSASVSTQQNSCLCGLQSLNLNREQTSQSEMYSYFTFNFADSTRNCTRPKFVFLSTLPSSCDSSNGLPDNLLYFPSWTDVTLSLTQTHSSSLTCVFPSIWEVQITENGVTSTAYLALLFSALSSCPIDLSACGTHRVAIPKPNPYAEVTIDINAIRDTCINQLIADATQAALNNYQRYVDSLLTEYFASVQNCWNNPFNESFTVTYDQSEYHHTLYYYDQAGNLVQTIPPAGVRMLDASHFDANGVWDRTEPQHILPTCYQYNSIGQIVKQTSPDAGLATFYFDDVQRLRLSQNAQQALNNQYSFISYDDQARIARSGQISNYNVSNTQLYTDINDLAFPYSYGVLAYSLNQVTSTSYDFPINPNPNFPQYNLRGRVATIQNDNITTYYSYDILGNVHTLYQDVVGFKSFKTEYKYDLITSKVNQVAYQPGQVDALFHQYSYDADLRLNRMVSATVAWQAFAQDNHYQLLNPSAEARYFYYTHGPLARTEIGEQVAGNDFRYSLQGWIMGVNHVQNEMDDAGLDGSLIEYEDPIFIKPSMFNKWMARDEFAYALGYHDQAYTPIGSTNLSNSAWSDMSADILGIGANKGLFNGNIAHMLVRVNQLEKQQAGTGLVGFAYQYDQLHRIKQSKDYYLDLDSKWQPNYTASTNYNYDPNGNITHLSRVAPVGGSPALIDDFTYNYNLNSNGDLINNRLNYIADQAGGFPIGDLGNQSNNNYVYNAIGQLVSDVSQGIEGIGWTIQAKVDRVKFNNGKPNVYYTYDALGNRLTKLVDGVTTYYIRDAQGNTLATYEQNGNNTNLTEQHLYSSGRIGMRQTNLLVKNSAGIVSLNPNQRVFYRSVGHKAYEQTNHLGDVLVTLSDKVLNQGGYYQAIVKNASLTYPFGWAIPERTYTSASGEYRFGFNGVEKSPEIGEGHMTTFYREMDTRSARWWSTDPVFQPWQSPYNSMDGNPILLNDPKGDCPWCVPFVIGLLLTPTPVHNHTDPQNWAADDEKIRQATEASHQWILSVLEMPLSGFSLATVKVFGKRTFMDKVKGFWKRLVDADYRKAAREAREFIEEQSRDLVMDEALGVDAPFAEIIPISTPKLSLKPSRRKDSNRKSNKSANEKPKGRNPNIDCGCFTAGTKVKTADGYEDIENVVIGDYIWAMDDSTQTMALKKVIALHRYTRDSLVHIFVGNQHIKTTTEHPFYTQYLWKKASLLTPADSLFLFNHSWLKVDSIHFEPGIFPVYNFTIQDFHTYFVSSQDVLVHNIPCPEFEPIELRPVKNKPHLTPKGGAAKINREIKEIAEGRGTPRIDPDTNQPTIYQGRENSEWAGSIEYEIPGLDNNFRILKQSKVDSKGNPYTRYAWSREHYEDIKPFKEKK